METTIKKTERAEYKQRINSLVRRLIDDAQKDFVVDRRREHRHPVSVPVIVRPIGDRHMTDGFVAVTRDISTRGVSFFHTAPINYHYLTLHFPESQQSTEAVTIEVLRCHKIGPLFEIAGKFLLR